MALGLRGRLLLAFLLPTLIVLGVGSTGLYRAARSSLEAELGRSLADVAATVSTQLKAERVLSVEAGDDQGEGSRTWRSLHAQLDEVRRRTSIRRIVVTDAQRRVRLDVGGSTPAMSDATDLLRDELEVSRVLTSGERTSSQVLFTGTDGQFYKTGYAPLTQEGQPAPVGLVAVEGSAAFFGQLGQLRNAFIAMLALTLALLAAAAVASARALAGPLERLVAAALRIGGGDLTTAVDASRERTREIALLAGELEAMRQALESRDRQLKLMLGGVAHEVKNPLGGMELFAGLLDEELGGSAPNLVDAREHLGRVRRELDYLKRIVEDFLAFAKERKLQAAPFEADALVQAAAQHLAGEAAGKQVELVVEAASATLKGDQSLLTSALVNLIKNAVQISTAGQRVTVTGRVVDGGYAIEVRDEGPGIAAEQQERIFEPFFTTREKGTGLGLPLARKLAEAHRGSLTLESKPGATVFTLRLP